MLNEKKKIAILGSTGSIGTQALDVIQSHSDKFEIEVLTAQNNADLLIQQACALVSNEIGKFAKPGYIQWTNALPKTRSGKIMRRLLRKIASGDYSELGDTSTLAEPLVVETLIAEQQLVKAII